MQERAMTSDKIRELTNAELTDDALEAISGGKGVINSSAISLPKPAYPAIA